MRSILSFTLGAEHAVIVIMCLTYFTDCLPVSFMFLCMTRFHSLYGIKTSLYNYTTYFILSFINKINTNIFFLIVNHIA